MKRSRVNFKKSAKAFKRKARLVNKKNTPSYRASRGGYRL